jgi:hypothetical protein
MRAIGGSYDAAEQIVEQKFLCYNRQAVKLPDIKNGQIIGNLHEIQHAPPY